MPFEKGHKLGKGRPKGSPNRFSNKLERETRLHNLENFVNCFSSGSYYVYYHTDITGNVFYIGKGIGDRAWQTTNKCRNDKWADFVSKNEYKVNIIASNLSEEEALAIERVLIEINKPNCNIDYAI